MQHEEIAEVEEVQEVTEEVAEIEETEEIADFDEEADIPLEVEAEGESGATDHMVGVHSSGFKDFLLKRPLLDAIRDAGFEHPSEVQHQAIPQANLGSDILCQAKSGMGKTCVFVLSTLQQIEPVDGEVHAVVLCHTRELAHQIMKEYARFTLHMPNVSVGCVVGGIPKTEDIKMINEKKPHIIVGTPGRMMDLVESKDIDASNIKFFVVDECDRVLIERKMRLQVQKIFVATPREKQTMLFSATVSDEARVVCRKFLKDPFEITVDDKKICLAGLKQYFLKLSEAEKTQKLISLLDALDFNQVIIFLNNIERAVMLDKILNKACFPSMVITSRMKTEQRLEAYDNFKKHAKRILVSTELLGRGADFSGVNVVINYDYPAGVDDYLHRVGRAGRFGTKGLAVSFISSKEDNELLDKTQERFKVAIPEMPDSIDASSYK